MTPTNASEEARAREVLAMCCDNVARCPWSNDTPVSALESVNAMLVFAGLPRTGNSSETLHAAFAKPSPDTVSDEQDYRDGVAYQAIGALADKAGLHGDPAVIKAMNYFSIGGGDPLPFALDTVSGEVERGYAAGIKAAAQVAERWTKKENAWATTAECAGNSIAAAIRSLASPDALEG